MEHKHKRACERIQPRLSDYADGELNRRQAAEVQAHVCSCFACANELERIHALRDLMREAAKVQEMPARVHASVMSAVSQMPRTEQRRKASHVVWLRRLGGAMACVGCLVVIGVAVLTGGVGNKAFDAMMPEANAPMGSTPEASDAADVPYIDADSPEYGLNDKPDRYPEEPMDPEVPMEPGTVPMAPGSSAELEQPEVLPPQASVVGKTYALQRISGEGEGLDGVWTCDDLKISFSSEAQRVKVWFARESSREGSYELTDTELIVGVEEGGRISFDMKMEEGSLWLTRK
jgi:hypothetical protein